MTTKKKTGLGRGLNTLIPSAPVKDTESEKILKKEEQIKSEIMVPILKVEPNPNQPRRQFDDDSLQELADSVKQYGILQPLIVKKHDKFYEIIAGERRWRAAKLAGLKEVPVLIRDYAENEIVEIALIENIQREDLNPIEEALAYGGIFTEAGPGGGKSFEEPCCHHEFTETFETGSEGPKFVVGRNDHYGACPRTSGD